MEKKKKDLRVMRTQKLIKDAFLRLIKEKGFQTITIRDIADEAMINRATFYLHYQDKYDLLEQMSNFYLQELMEVMDISFHLKDGEVNVKRFKITLKNIFENIQKNKEFYTVMLGPNGMSDFTEKIERHLFDKFKAHFGTLVEQMKLKFPTDFLLSFISSAYIGVTKWWLNEGCNYSPDFMAENLANIITKGPMNTIGYRVNFK